MDAICSSCFLSWPLSVKRSVMNLISSCSFASDEQRRWARHSSDLKVAMAMAMAMGGKNKKKLTYELKVREALEIKRHNCGPGHGLNEDYGAYVKTTQWNPVFHDMGPT